MKILIPAKKNSTRVTNKNWRDFYSGKCLVDIKIEQLLNCADPDDIFLSSDYNDYEEKAKAYGINFISRNPLLASDETPWPDAFAGMINEMPVDDNEDIAWVEVINPLFGDYTRLFSEWEKQKNAFDSLVLVSGFNKFLMNDKGMPLNFMYGKWHAMSQNKEAQYVWDSACIMKKKDMLYYSYPIGKKPFLYVLDENAVDIDSTSEFELAAILYERKVKREKGQS